MGAWIETVERLLNDGVVKSHPSWVRGLKHKASTIQKWKNWSHPSWVRGLKRVNACDIDVVPPVAPLVGAWIETLMSVDMANQQPVAPLVGAWIETNMLIMFIIILLSHPSWVRGLKHHLYFTLSLLTRSHPSWVRGLKLKALLIVLILRCRTPRGCVD